MHVKEGQLRLSPIFGRFGWRSRETSAGLRSRSSFCGFCWRSGQRKAVRWTTIFCVVFVGVYVKEQQFGV